MIIGVLRVHDGCIWIHTEGGANLVLWPQEVSLGTDATGNIQVMQMPGASAPIAMGSTVEMGGGQYKDERFVTERIHESIPQACRAERYWLATRLEKVHT